MLEFDAETTRILENCYRGRDISNRRRLSLNALDPQPGDRVLDIGCGNGMLTEELARATGPKGEVIGIDPSADMRQPAIARCRGFEWVTITDGTTHALPVADASVDKAVSLQVFEYLDDVQGALAEVFRILKPGGRVVIGDTHFGSLIWFSDDPERMNRMTASWNRHCTDIVLPETLHGLLQDAGFRIEQIRPLVFCDPVLRQDGIAFMFLRLMERYAIQNGHLPKDEVMQWRAEQEKLAEEGRFFFSLNHYAVSATKP